MHGGIHRNLAAKVVFKLVLPHAPRRCVRQQLGQPLEDRRKELRKSGRRGGASSLPPVCTPTCRDSNVADRRAL